MGQNLIFLKNNSLCKAVILDKLKFRPIFNPFHPKFTPLDSAIMVLEISKLKVTLFAHQDMHTYYVSMYMYVHTCTYI